MLVAAGAPDRIAKAFRAVGHPLPEDRDPDA
jgi:hypothetical protein